MMMNELLLQAKAVFFDLDGTLVDSAADIHTALNHALEKNHFSMVTLDQLRGWIGRGARVLVESAHRYCLLSESVQSNTSVVVSVDTLLDEFLAYYQDNVCASTQIYSGVIPVLDALQQAGKRLVCITNKPIIPAQRLLDALNLSQYFILVLGGDSLAEKKPSPMPLLYALDYCCVSASDAVMVGDSQFDVLAAQAANVHSVAVSGGYNHGIPITASHPSLVVASFLDLL